MREINLHLKNYQKMLSEARTTYITPLSSTSHQLQSSKEGIRLRASSRRPRLSIKLESFRSVALRTTACSNFRRRSVRNVGNILGCIGWRNHVRNSLAEKVQTSLQIVSVDIHCFLTLLVDIHLGLMSPFHQLLNQTTDLLIITLFTSLF